MAEQKRPLTRTLLEVRIAEAQIELNTALEKKAYLECGPLQEKLETLKGKRPELPTIDELREALSIVETEVAAAVESRDFVAAAAGQTRINLAKTKLDIAIATERPVSDFDLVNIPENSTSRFDSRADLEIEISGLSRKIKSAIDAKDFKLATELQHSMDQSESLRSEYPSLMELQDNLIENKSLLQKAVREKNFVLAENLKEGIELLEKTIKKEEVRDSKTTNISNLTSTNRETVMSPEGLEKSFESRAKLEIEISQANKSLSEAVFTRSFKAAQSLQSFVESLEALRKNLPSIVENEVTLGNKKKLLENAIMTKDFLSAELFNAEISSLESMIALEKSSELLPNDIKQSPGAQSIPVFVVHPERVERKIVTKAKNHQSHLGAGTSAEYNVKMQRETRQVSKDRKSVV